MGIVWAVASPLLYLLVFYFLFGYVFVVGVERYASFVFIGIVAWTWLQNTVFEAVPCIVHNPSLVAQPRFPVAALPAAITVSNLLNVFFALPVILGLAALEGAAPGRALLALPAVLACQFLLVLALAYLVAAVNVVFRDMQHIAPVLLQLGFFCSGIFFDVAALPEAVRAALSLNPMVHLLDAHRAVLLHGVWPDWTALGVVATLSAALLVLARGRFRAASRDFLEEI